MAQDHSLSNDVFDESNAGAAAVANQTTIEDQVVPNGIQERENGAAECGAAESVVMVPVGKHSQVCSRDSGFSSQCSRLEPPPPPNLPANGENVAERSSQSTPEIGDGGVYSVTDNFIIKSDPGYCQGIRTPPP